MLFVNVQWEDLAVAKLSFSGSIFFADKRTPITSSAENTYKKVEPLKESFATTRSSHCRLGYLKLIVIVDIKRVSQFIKCLKVSGVSVLHLYALFNLFRLVVSGQLRTKLILHLAHGKR